MWTCVGLYISLMMKESIEGLTYAWGWQTTGVLPWWSWRLRLTRTPLKTTLVSMVRLSQTEMLFCRTRSQENYSEHQMWITLLNRPRKYTHTNILFKLTTCFITSVANLRRKTTVSLFLISFAVCFFPRVAFKQRWADLLTCSVSVSLGVCV